MSDYTPRVGDRVRRTFLSGTVMEGEVDFILEGGSAADQDGNLLFSRHLPQESELLHRPVEFKDEVGISYRHPQDPARVVVRADKSAIPWLGKLYSASDEVWHEADSVREVIEREGWVEHDLREASNTDCPIDPEYGPLHEVALEFLDAEKPPHPLESARPGEIWNVNGVNFFLYQYVTGILNGVSKGGQVIVVEEMIAEGAEVWKVD